ncbi:hypothetical protein ACC712_38785, partial [Rhizobium ruizarguesonis]
KRKEERKRGREKEEKKEREKGEKGKRKEKGKKGGKRENGEAAGAEEERQHRRSRRTADRGGRPAGRTQRSADGKGR